jgi:hypothetical protein
MAVLAKPLVFPRSALFAHSSVRGSGGETVKSVVPFSRVATGQAAVSAQAICATARATPNQREANKFCCRSHIISFQVKITPLPFSLGLSPVFNISRGIFPRNWALLLFLHSDKQRTGVKTDHPTAKFFLVKPDHSSVCSNSRNALSSSSEWTK